MEKFGLVLDLHKFLIDYKAFIKNIIWQLTSNSYIADIKSQTKENNNAHLFQNMGKQKSKIWWESVKTYNQWHSRT